MTNLTLTKKLVLLATSLLLGLIAVGGFGVYESRILSENIRQLVDREVPKTRHLVLIDMVHDGVRSATTAAFLGATEHNSERIADAEKDLTEFKKNVAESYDVISKTSPSAKLQEELKSTQALMNLYQEAALVVIRDAKLGNLENTAKSFKAFVAQFEVLEKALAAQSEHAEVEGKEFFGVVTANAEKASLLSIALMIGALLGGLAVTFGVIRSLKNTLNQVGQNLTQSSNDLGTVVSQLTGASQELASASTQQAAALQQTAASIEEIAAMAKKTGDAAVQSERVSDASKKKAERGQEVVAQMVESMKAITASNAGINIEVTNSNKKISEIVNVIREIGNKTKVINDIVFQTKLLSFNASVEAARAGEHGKGFAVVAEEVGNLASMSGNAAKDITSLLDGSIKRVEDIVGETNSKVGRLIQEAQATVSQGSSVAVECGTVLEDVVTSASEVSQMIASIASAGQEQARGVEEISKAIHQLDQVTQTNSAAASRCSSTVVVLSSQIKDLRGTNHELQMLLRGRGDQQSNGVEHLDQAHQTLIQKFDSLVETLESKNQDQILRNLGELEAFVRDHFDHEDLVSKLADSRAKAKDGDLDARALTDFLHDWLRREVTGADHEHAEIQHSSKKSAPIKRAA